MRIIEGKPFNDDLFKVIFGFLSVHEQLCRIAYVSNSFRRIVYDVIKSDPSHKYLSAQAQSFDLPNYTSHQFFHAGRLCHQEFDNYHTSAWSFAAFMGDADASPQNIKVNQSDG